ncbi:MAG: hypothetical protein WAK01_10860 [Methylocystis sp.]
MLGIDARQFARLCQMGLAGAENSDNVQLLVRFGKISPEAAEQWATERNLPLFAGRPEASIFDPLGQLAWTPLQAVAWIAYRDVERVRDVSQAFRDHWRIWRDPGPFILFEGAIISGCDMGLKDPPIFRGWDLALVPPASFAELFREENKKSVQAAKELQARLISGAIVASGFKDWSGSRVVIPALEWHEMCFDPHSADLASFPWPRTNAYSGVLIPREDVLANWKAPRKAPANASTKTQCRDWLIGLRNDGKPLKTKDEYKREAKERFDVGPDQFRSAWKEAQEAAPSPEWSSPGRPRKSSGPESSGQ